MQTRHAQPLFPFSQSIELIRQAPLGGDYFHWKAEAARNVLRICTWCVDAAGMPVAGRVIQTITHDQCMDEDPVLEMWRRASDKLNRMAFHISNGC